MKNDVGVGMSGEATRMRDADASEHDMIAVAEGVHVEAVAGAYVGERRHAYGFGADEIVIGGEFHVGGLAGENRDAMPGPFGKRGVVGKIVAAGRRRTPCASTIRSKAKACGVCTMRSRLRSSVSITVSRSSTCLTVSATAIAGYRRAVLCRGVDGAGDKRAGQERPRRIMDEHEVGPGGAERLEPGANRGLPCGAARNRRQQVLEAGGRGAKRPASSG